MNSNTISILGSTGSIGVNTLRVVEHLGTLKVAGLSAGNNVEKLAEQIIQFRPEVVSMASDSACADLEERLGKVLNNEEMPKIVPGIDGLCEVAGHDSVETVVSATVGAIGLVPTLHAIEKKKRIALANKETLVVAGELMTKAAEENGVEVLPVDSEHNAIHQCLRGEKRSEVRRLILTASGGPFREKTVDEIRNCSVEEALDHPTWDMGDKISIDSSTLMNKGLEVIEAHWLFGFGADQIGVVVHPQSVVHSMVEYVDGSIVAQMGVTDMKHAIQYALTHPDRFENCLPPLDFNSISELNFENPDFERFPNLKLAFEALEMGGTGPAVLNASNEVAVDAFLNRKIPMYGIFEINHKMLKSHNAESIESLETVLGIDEITRKEAEKLVSSYETAVSA